MTIFRSPSELQANGRKVCVAIGMFDGVHLGHQQVLRHTVQDARQQQGLAVAVTFDKHPSAIVAPQRTPQLIYSLSQKLETISSMGLDAILLLEFNPEFSRQTGEQFIHWLTTGFHSLHSISVGNNFAFGHKRSGTVELLKSLGPSLGFLLNGLSAVSIGGRIVSSTRIREHITHGDLSQATECLGRNYTLRSRVVRGDQIGRTLGFPTANLDISGLATPPNGVYAVTAKVRDTYFQGVANIGVRPTLANPLPQKRLETFLFDFSEEIYGEELELGFQAKLREERKFPSTEALREQIVLDIAAAKKSF